MTARSSPQVDLARLPRAGLFAALAAGGFNAGLYGLGRSLGLTLVLPLPSGPEPLGLSLVLAASLGAALAGTAVLGLLALLAPRPFAVFRAVAFVALLVSLSGPLHAPGLDPRARTLLNAMHVSAAILIVRVLTLVPRREEAF